MTEPEKKTMNDALGKVLKRLHYPIECCYWELERAEGRDPYEDGED